MSLPKTQSKYAKMTEEEKESFWFEEFNKAIKRNRKIDHAEKEKFAHLLEKQKTETLKD